MVAVTVSISGTRRAPCVSLVFTEALDSPFPIKREGRLRHGEAVWATAPAARSRGPSEVQVFPPRVSGTSKANLCGAVRWGSPPTPSRSQRRRPVPVDPNFQCALFKDVSGSCSVGNGGLRQRA